MPYIEHKKRQIYFEDTGDGPVLVLGHSFLCSTEMWCEQIGPLAEAHRVVNIDYRGHGRSDPGDEPFTLYDLLDDTLAILDHLEIESAVWGGLSTGGMVALRAALTTPDRVRGLILMDTDAGAERRVVAMKYRAMIAGARIVGIRPLIPLVLPLMFGRTTLRNNRALVEQWRPKLMEPDIATISRWAEALINREPLLPRLSEIDVPTLVVVGSEDKSLPPSLSREMDKRLPDSELVVVPEAGHLSALEQPEAVTAAILEFLKF